MRFLKVSLAILLVLAMTLTLISCTPTSTEPTTYTVTFDLNYEGAPEAQKFTVESGERATKPETDPTRPNYEFKGWFVDKECLIEQTFLSSGVTQSPINKITADTTFYAKWEPITAKAKLVSITATYVGGDVEIGQPLNTSLISVTATYDDDTTKKVTGFEVSKLDSSEAGEKTVTVTYTEDGVTVTCNLTIKVVDGGGTVEPTGTTLYFKTESAWEEVYIYTYTPELNGVWPGELMTPVEDHEGWYSYTFEEGVEPTNVIFNNNDKAQTGNLTYDGTNNYYAYNPVINAGQWGSDFTVTAPTEAPTVKLYFYNHLNWATVNAYVWAGSTEYAGGWPGTAMTADTENAGWFFIEVNENATNVIFNDGGENQTEDLTIVATTLYYYDGTWYETMPHIHTYSGDCDATCNECGEARETTAEHTYDNACDTDCNVCGEVRETTHDYETKHDETYHWTKCSECGATTEKVAHAWDEGTVTTEPTCTTAGVKTFTCECGATKTEEIPMLAHSYGEEWLSNETGHWHACQCGATTEVEAHVPNIEQPTEEESQVCTVCGYVIAPAISHTHTPDTEWTSDETYHWHACNGCDEQLDKAEHLFNQEVATEEYLATSATCTAKATYYYSCECGAKGAETFENGETIAHQYVVDHDDAQHWNKCSVCGYIDETSREDHVYVEGSCTCGAEDPAQQTTTTYYFYNFAKWTEVSAYTWADPATEGEAATEFNGAFPGQTMTEWEGHPGWYYIEVDSNAQNIIFNGMSGETRMQTNTLQLGEDVYHAILGWSSQPSVENIVVLDTTGGSWGEADAVLKLYYWNDGGDGWIDFQAVAGTGTANKYFALSIADCEIAGFKLVRKATGVTENGWNDVWNETNDLTVDAGLYVSIPSDNWNWGMQSAV